VALPALGLNRADLFKHAQRASYVALVHVRHSRDDLKRRKTAPLSVDMGNEREKNAQLTRGLNVRHPLHREDRELLATG